MRIPIAPQKSSTEGAPLKCPRGFELFEGKYCFNKINEDDIWEVQAQVSRLHQRGKGEAWFNFSFTHDAGKGRLGLMFRLHTTRKGEAWLNGSFTDHAGQGKLGYGSFTHHAGKGNFFMYIFVLIFACKVNEEEPK